MKMLFKAAATVCAMCAAHSVPAETLTVDGVYPAGNNQAAALDSIAVERLGGPDGSRLSSLISDRLRDARVNGEPWFRIYSGSFATDAEAALSGYVGTDIRIDESYDKEVSVCVERDDRRKCVRKVKERIPCDVARIRVTPELRLVGRDGRLVHSGNFTVNRERRFCADENQPSFNPLVDEALTEIADRIRKELAPQQLRKDLRVFESRKGMDKEAGKQFREAIRMTKRDEDGACLAFAALEPTIGSHRSLIFNLGLCAEKAQDFEKAAYYYRKSMAVDGDRTYAEAGLDRIQDRLVAMNQIEARYR